MQALDETDAPRHMVAVSLLLDLDPTHLNGLAEVADFAISEGQGPWPLVASPDCSEALSLLFASFIEGGAITAGRPAAEVSPLQRLLLKGWHYDEEGQLVGP